MNWLQLDARTLRYCFWTVGGLLMVAAGIVWYLINTDVLQGTFRQMFGNILLFLVGTVLAYYGYEITPPVEGTIVRLKPERSQIVIQDRRGNLATITLSEQDYNTEAQLDRHYSGVCADDSTT